MSARVLLATVSPVRAWRLACAALLAACSLAYAAPALAAAEAPPARVAYVTGTSLPHVWLAAASGIEPKLLGPGDDPLLAPDGQAVAASLFGATSGNEERGPAIAVYSALGTPPADYLDLETATYSPLAWSPDSRYLAVWQQSTALTEIAASSGLVVIDTQTGASYSIAHGAIYGASFARDGSDRIVFAKAPSLNSSAPANLYVSAANGSGLKRLTSDGRSLFPVWGPHAIAFDKERLRGRDAFPAYQLYLMAPTGGRARRLTNLKIPQLLSGLVPLAFSADGSRLLAEFEGEDTSEAWTVNASSGRARRVTVRGRSVEGAGISSDGSSLLIDENALEVSPSSGRVAVIPFAGGRSKVIVAHGSQASWNR